MLNLKSQKSTELILYYVFSTHIKKKNNLKTNEEKNISLF